MQGGSLDAQQLSCLECPVLAAEGRANAQAAEAERLVP